MVPFSYHNVRGDIMEAIMIAGVAALAAGGYYALQDLLADLGITVRKSKVETKKSYFSDKGILTSQRRVKKVAGMYV